MTNHDQFTSLGRVCLFLTPWSAACQASLSFTISQSLLKLLFFELVVTSNHLILCCPPLLLPPIFLRIGVFSNEWAYQVPKILEGFPDSGKESTCNAGDSGSTPGLGRWTGEGKGCPLQYSGLEDSMGSQSQTGLSNCHFHFHFRVLELQLQHRPSDEYSGLISFRIDWFDLLVVQGNLKSLLQHPSWKASTLQCSAFFMVKLSHL